MNALLAAAFLFVLLISTHAEPAPVDGFYHRAEFVDVNLKTKERIYLRYFIGSDSGAKLESMLGDKVQWSAEVENLGIEHSAYRQDATICLRDGKLMVTIRGAKIINETRDVKTGKLLTRTVTAN